MIGLRRSLALLVAGTTLPLLVFSAFAVYLYDREQSAAADRALLDAARGLVVALDKHFEATITGLRVLGSSEHLDAGDLRAFHQQSRRALETRSEWRTISLFDAGQRRLSITSEPIGKELPGPPPVMSGPFRQLVDRRTPNVSDLFRSPLTRQHSVAVGVPVLRGADVRWVISAGIRAEGIAGVLASQRIPPEWTGAILDRSYVVVARSGADRILAEPAPAGFAEAAARTGEGTFRGQPTGSRPTLTAFSRSRLFGWTASVAKPVPAGVLRQPVRAILAVGAVFLLIGIAIALWAGRQIARPIEALASVARQIGRGDAVQEVPSRVREVTALSTALVDAARNRAAAQTALARYAERLEILHEIDRSLIAEEAPAAVAHAALRRLRPLLGVPRAVVTVFDPAAGEGESIAVDGRGDAMLGPGVRFPLAIMGDLEALRRGDLLVVEDVAAVDHPQAQALLAQGIRSYLVIPLVAGAELIGSLNFGAEQPGQFPAEQVSIAREVAAQLAITIRHARLYERVRRHTEELETRVRERTQELDRANRAKSDFLSRMSHDLRTPLNGILGFGQLLEMESLSDDQKESVDQILKAGRHLLGLINEVLDIARIEAGHLQLSLEPVSVAETVGAAVALVRPLAARRNITVRVETAGDERHVMADQQRLQQVLLNLLSNAVKYNRPDGVVTVWCAAADDRLQIRVRDTGMGIAPEQIARLFTPFERLHAEAIGVEGTGLGLTLVKQLVEAMGGSVQVDSAIGAGTTFSVELPAVAAPLAALPAPAPATAVPETRSPGAEQVVLYIEDNLSNLRLVERVLARRPGIRLLSAMQGRVGLDLAREHRPDVILLDLHLPDVSGDEVLRLLRADPRTRDVPVVMLSAEASPAQIERLLQAGALAYLTKPLDVQKFLATVDEAVRRRGETRGERE